MLSTDVIDRQFDPSTQRLSTTRLHLKKSKIPSTILRLLPKGILGAGGDAGHSYVIEKSVVDIREGWMKTESRNLEWTGILSVIEKQTYRRPISDDGTLRGPTCTSLVVDDEKYNGTDVTTIVTLVSRFGQSRLVTNRRKEVSTTEISPAGDEAPTTKRGFFSAWSTSSMQRSIEHVGLRRTRDALVKSKDGMNIVLERLRLGGLVAVLEGMRRDRETAFGGQDGPWKRAA